MTKTRSVLGYVLGPVKRQQKIIICSQFPEDDMLWFGYLCGLKKRWCSGSHTKKSSHSWIKLSASRKHYSTHIHHFLYVVCGSIHCLYINYSYKSQWIYNNLSSEYNGWVSLQSTLKKKPLVMLLEEDSWKMKLPCLRYW